MTISTYTPPPFPCKIVVVQTTGQLGKTFIFERKDWCVLGANADCDIIVPFPGVAQLQAFVHVKRNGVFLQGIDKQLPVKHPRLQKHLINEEEVLLLPGDIFLLGERKFLIEYSAEDASIEGSLGNISSAQGPSTSRVDSKGSNRATPRSTGFQKKRRKSSLVVGEFDEKYVFPRGGTEKLLSKTQLARISQSEVDILPGGGSNRNLNDRESSSPQTKSGECMQAAGGSSCSSSSDDSTVLSNHQDIVSRNIDFSPVENEESTAETGDQLDTEVENHRKVSFCKRKDLVFARLSKGLSATPRKGEKDAFNSRANAFVQKESGYSQFEKTTTFAGKENVPQLCDQASKSFKPQDSKEDHRFSKLRSPLARRAELGNQLVPSCNQNGAPESSRLMQVANPSNPSVVETPRGRSVAFASAIELTAGAHYSPYRPKRDASVIRSTFQSEEQEQSARLVGSVKRQGFPSSLAGGSPSPKQKKALVAKKYEQGPAPTSSLEQLGTFFYAEQLPRDASGQNAQPVVEYEDDSDPPTPSSTEEGPEGMDPQVPDPSPMARVGGALAAFLKRLSGTLESDEDDSCSEAEGASSHKRPSLTKSQQKLPGKNMSSSEPVMSKSELMGLSCCIPPERRKEFTAQVEDAAKDMRQAMNPVSEQLTEEPLCSPKGTLAIEEMTQAVLEKVEDGRTEPLVSADGNLSKDLLKPGGSDAKERTICEEGHKSQISSASTGLDHAAEGEEVFSSEDDQPISEAPLGTTPLPEENLEAHSTPSREYKGPSELSSSGSDSADLEIEELFSAGANGGHQSDLRSEESEGDEIDYGDEEEQSSMESSDREVAAVVVDDEADLIHYFTTDADNRSQVEESGILEPETEEIGEFQGTETAGTERGPSASIPVSRNTKRNKAQSDGSVGEQLRVEGDEISGESAAVCISTRRKGPKEIVPEVVELTQINSEADGVTNVTSASGSSAEVDDITIRNQDAIGSGTSELEEKSSQIATLRKELSRLKKDELKARLLQRKLDTSGLKKDLVERLILHISEATTSVGNQQPEEKTSTPPRKRIDEKETATVPTSASPDPAPTVLTTDPGSPGVHSTRREIRTMARKSARKTRVRFQLETDEAKSAPTDTSRIAAEPQTEIESEEGSDLSLYRRRTVKELRQFLKDRGLDIQQRMRKEELIQHLVSLSIGSDGQSLSNITEGDTPKTAEAKTPKATEAKTPKAADAKTSKAAEARTPSCSGPVHPFPTDTPRAHHKMTVAQLRAQLSERGQCQVGTKKVLLERLSLRPERRTRSRRNADATSCSSCQAGQVCEAEGKR